MIGPGLQDHLVLRSSSALLGARYGHRPLARIRGGAECLIESQRLGQFGSVTHTRPGGPAWGRSPGRQVGSIWAAAASSFVAAPARPSRLVRTADTSKTAPRGGTVVNLGGG
jgi:hypothetical protein